MRVSCPSRKRVNVSQFRASIDNGKYVFDTVNVAWGRTKKVWYVKSVEAISTPKGGKQSKVLLSFDEFQPNVEIPKSLLRFDSLELIRGTRIFDHRVKDKPVEYRYPWSP